MSYRHFLLILIVFLSFRQIGTAQQRPHYSQYVLNNYLINPALSGIENYADVRIGHRKQWSGLTDAPRTSFVTANWSLGDAYLWGNPLSFSEKGENPMSRNYLQNYTASPAHHGMGIVAVIDQAAQIRTAVFNISYAYHLQLNNQMNLSVGLAAGLSKTGINVDALRLEEAIDPALRNVVENQLKPDLSVGTWLYGPDFFAGISIQQILPQTLAFTDDQNYQQGKQEAHAFATAGYKHFFAEDFYVLPSIMTKYVKHTPLSVDLNVKIGFKDRIWLGGGYRKKDAFVAMAGLNISQLINVGYAYDFTTSNLNQVSSGSHELVLGILLNNVYRVVCPQRMW